MFFVFQSVDMSKEMSQDLHICVEGTIGVGKTTILNRLADELQTVLETPCEILQEPLEKWVEFGKNKVNLLQLMYLDPVKYGASFQTLACSTKIEQLAGKKGVRLVERSLGAQANIFIPILLQQKSLSDINAEILTQLIRVTSNITSGLEPHCIVYLRTSPEVAINRIRKRGRSEEANISVQYLQQLSDHYDLWLLKNESIPVVVVEAVEMDILKIVQEIMFKLK